ncbi:ankyrin repeat domain-containing protein, partial [Wolbachia endosymbiont of Cylisticus convexus]|uniref:ankyrin repeat domain-containing protein n=1 Tax=Wolbachia endosymbiont of Cylisticus convexus TaxID=118728 RepID=UPI0015D06AE0
DVNAKNIYGETPLHLAARSGYLNVVEKLIEKGANVNAKNSNGKTPLHYAAEKGYLNVVEKLIEKGAYFDAENNKQQKPLDISRVNSYSEISKFLSNIEELFNVAKEDNLNRVEELINQGARVNAKNSDSNTPLH